MLPLIIAPTPILRQKGKTLAFPLTSEVRTLALEMFEAMAHYDGIGLAAPQVNHSIQLMVIATPQQPTAFVNPKILKASWKKVSMEEGCLSLPGLFGVVRRPEKILVTYSTLDGETREEWLQGMIARVFQHEVDHLNGVLFLDRTKKFTTGKELLKTYAPK